MHKILMTIVALILLPTAPVHAQGKMQCTETELKKMEDDAEKMSEHKSAMMKHIELARAELKKGNKKECMKHMEEAHASMK